MNQIVPLRSPPRSAALDAARPSVAIGVVAEQGGGAQAVSIAVDTVAGARLAVELRDADGNAILRRPLRALAGVRRQRAVFALPKKDGARPLAVWLSREEDSVAPAPVGNIRFETFDAASAEAIGQWAVTDGYLIDDQFIVPPGRVLTMRSPPIAVEAGERLLVCGEWLLAGGGEVRVRVEDAAGRSHGRSYEAHADFAFALPHTAAAAGSVRLVIQADNSAAAVPCILSDMRVSWRRFEAGARSVAETDTEMAHWGRLQRAVHRRCKASRRFNNAVCAIETRLGREELLSLPQYMAICPTGQCNALCDFCSVTVNRTGILKRQLPHDTLTRFLTPVRNTVQVFGLEGNGEPTLYRDFLPLLTDVTSGGTDAYLITNASRLDHETLTHLALLESVNVSLNAATAETHRKVMKLKEFEPGVEAIRRLQRMRGRKPNGEPAAPRISVSFVVTHDNVHEVERFLDFAENDLKVDVVYIRPLSELGNDLGVVEDVRRIVPYASDVADMLAGVEDYRRTRRTRLDIRCDQATFRSVRPDPVGRLVMPQGYEDRLLAPRTGWQTSPGTSTEWRQGAVEVFSPAGVTPEARLTSAPIPVASGVRRIFEAAVDLRAGACVLRIECEGSGDVLARTEVGVGENSVRLELDPRSAEAVRIVVASLAGFAGTIDFGRLRLPSSFVREDFSVPRPGRWERGVPQADHRWKDGRLSLRSDAAPGLYIVRSFAEPCAAGRIVHLPVSADITRGEFGVGILDETGANFVGTASLTQEAPSTTVSFRTRNNEAVSIAIYALTPDGADGDLRFGSPETEIDPAWTKPQPVAEMPSAPVAAPDDDEDAPGLPTASDIVLPGSPVAQGGRSRRRDTPRARRRPRRWLRDLLLGRNTMYCHKPWTDMHNFTVDGRVDVCCIATGPSQEYYQLGNLSRQPFQDVWNGDRAREFRRTVNSEDPLPPCERCPMSHAYQGLWFDPIYTQGRWRSALYSKPFFNRTIMRYPSLGIYAAGAIAIQLLLFRGFRRDPLSFLGGGRTWVGRLFGSAS